MSCPYCLAAASDPMTGLFHADCTGCKARSLAKSPAFFDSIRANSFTPAYRNALRAVFGQHWREGHEQVKHWDQVQKERE